MHSRSPNLSDGYRRNAVFLKGIELRSGNVTAEAAFLHDFQARRSPSAR